MAGKDKKKAKKRKHARGGDTPAHEERSEEDKAGLPTYNAASFDSFQGVDKVWKSMNAPLIILELGLMIHGPLLFYCTFLNKRINTGSLPTRFKLFFEDILIKTPSEFFLRYKNGRNYLSHTFGC